MIKKFKMHESDSIREMQIIQKINEIIEAMNTGNIQL